TRRNPPPMDERQRIGSACPKPASDTAAHRPDSGPFGAAARFAGRQPTLLRRGLPGPPGAVSAKECWQFFSSHEPRKAIHGLLVLAWLGLLFAFLRFFALNRLHFGDNLLDRNIFVDFGELLQIRRRE